MLRSVAYRWRQLDMVAAADLPVLPFVPLGLGVRRSRRIRGFPGRGPASPSLRRVQATFPTSLSSSSWPHAGGRRVMGILANADGVTPRIGAQSARRDRPTTRRCVLAVGALAPGRRTMTGFRGATAVVGVGSDRLPQTWHQRTLVRTTSAAGNPGAPAPTQGPIRGRSTDSFPTPAIPARGWRSAPRLACARCDGRRRCGAAEAEALPRP